MTLGSRVALAALSAVYAVLVVAYATRTPLWQAPDEPAHFNYVRHVSKHWTPPLLDPGDYAHESLERLKSAGFPAGASTDDLEYEDHQPPLYYYLAGVAVAALPGEASTDRASVLAARLVSALLGLGAVLLAFAIVRVVFPNDMALALGTASFVAFLPMRVAIMAAVNSDALAELLVAAILLLCVRRAAGQLDASAFRWSAGLLLGLGLLTKLSVYATALVVVAAGLSSWDDTTSTAIPLRRRVGLSVSPVLLALVIGAPWFVRNALVYGVGDPLGLVRHAAVVTGQPRTSEWLASHGVAGLVSRAAAFTFDSFWGVFGWMGVFLDHRIYTLLAMTTAMAVAGLAAYLWRTWRQGQPALRRRGLPLLALQAALTAGGFVWYNLQFVQHQGRYLFPALIPIALFFMLGLGEWPRLLAPRLARWPGAAGWLEAAVSLGFAVALAGLAWLSLERYVVPGL